jgi:dUTPase
MKRVKIEIKNVNGLKLPVQASPFDAGYDMFAATDPRVVGTVALSSEDEKDWIYSDIQYIQYGTGLHIAPLDDYNPLGDGPFSSVNKYWVQAFPRSSIRKYNLFLKNGFATIDNQYRGEILLCYGYQYQPKDLVPLYDEYGKICGFGTKVDYNRIYKIGDAIAQMRPVENREIQWKIVGALDSTLRGERGFGGSGNNSIV